MKPSTSTSSIAPAAAAPDQPLLDAILKSINVLQDAPSSDIALLRQFSGVFNENCGALLGYLKTLGGILAAASAEPGASYRERKHAMLELSKRLISVFARLVDFLAQLPSTDALVTLISKLLMKTKDSLVRTLREANMKIDQLSSQTANPEERAPAPYLEPQYRELMKGTLDYVRQLVTAARQLKQTVLPSALAAISAPSPASSAAHAAPVVSSGAPPRPSTAPSSIAESTPSDSAASSSSSSPAPDSIAALNKFKIAKPSSTGGALAPSTNATDLIRSSASLLRRAPRFSGTANFPPPSTEGAATEWPPVVQQSDARFVVEDAAETFETAVLELQEDSYASEFYPSAHFNFVGLDNSGAAVSIVSVQSIPQSAYPALSSQLDMGTAYQALFLDKNGQQRLSIPALSLQALKGFSSNAPTPQLMEELLNARAVKEHKFYEVASSQHDDFADALLKLSEKHSQRIRHFKVAVLSVPARPALTMPDIFAHKPATNSPFYELLDSLAERVTLGPQWTNYRGDFDSSSVEPTYYTQWKGIEIMFHIAPWLSSEQHRRLIGNDIAVLAVPDAAPSSSPTSFDTSPLDGLGTVPQVHAVAQAVSDKKWRLGFFKRPNVKQFGPSTPPATFLFELSDVKDYLLTKLTNGVASAFSCPPMNRLNIVPRAAAIAELGQKFPKANKKTEKADKKKRDGTQDEDAGDLVVNLIAGRGLISRDDNGLSDPFVVLNLGDQKHKSAVVKKSLSPQWDAQFTFALRGTKPHDVLQLAVYDWNRISQAEYMGELVVPLSQCYAESGKSPQWYPLISKTGVLVAGDLQVKFTHVPGAKK